MLKSYFLIFILLLTGCTKDKTLEKSDKFIKNAKGEIYIAILENYAWHNAIPTGLSKKEVTIVNKLLVAAVDHMNAEAKAKPYDPLFRSANKSIKLDDYVRQYLPYINKESGEKEVVVCCLCSVRNDSWKKQLYMVSGGGSCYFQGLINLNTMTYEGFSINAPL